VPGAGTDRRSGYPPLRSLLHNWIDAVAAAGSQWVFWDEPDLDRGHARDALVPFLRDVAEYAREREVLNSVCPTSTVPNIPLLRDLAALESVDDIGTDPYYRRDVDQLDPDPEDYVGICADRVREAAEEHGKTSQVWVHASGHEDRIRRCTAVARAHGVSRIGVCGFRACEALDIRPAHPEAAWRVVRDALADQERG
jgi:hypothetical protein